MVWLASWSAVAPEGTLTPHTLYSEADNACYSCDERPMMGGLRVAGRMRAGHSCRAN